MKAKFLIIGDKIMFNDKVHIVTSLDLKSEYNAGNVIINKLIHVKPDHWFVVVYQAL